ncbi:HNH endonuclease signature motif containing protein [Protaetiibacter intestinalis]|uniref:HNH endonuclease n=1 Tax=Protaetiibacter intestinalis TaxID=2419774 RepID=A0A387B8G9_9MICO|nr:HNH endonuclease signature motif containing protein [Protaetiibacter intestinalis]AYF98647.1 HNH endonuclease [Protaetiibacter intestinalis]
MASITDTLARLGDVSTPFTAPAVGSLRDEELLTAQRALAEVRRRLDAVSTAIAGEIAHRSRRELGHSGLAQSQGQRTAEGLISQLSGGSAREARTWVKTAELLPTARIVPEAPPLAPWMKALGEAVAQAAISPEAAEVIRTRLTAAARPGAEDALAEAAARLVADAASLTIEQLVVRASRFRDEIDLAGIAERERELHEKRFLRFTKQPDGMTRVSGLLDPESAAIVIPVLDAVTAPRRSGPRFVDPAEAARAEDLVRDERTTEQLVVDAFVDLVRQGSRVDDGTLLGERKPAVRVLVTAKDLDGRNGAAYFEGQADAVSIATAERFICADGAIPLLFDGDGRVLNLGRAQRLFTEKQRVAIAARDGGCLMCDRPPSWCEAHHIDHWEEHHGRTDVDDGVLLCRFCHLLVHNRGWRIRRTGGDYTLEKPDGDRVIRATALPTRSPALQRMRASA